MKISNPNNLNYLKLIIIFVLLNNITYSQELWNKSYETAYHEVLKLNFQKSDSILSSVKPKINSTEAYIKSQKYFINVMLNNYEIESINSDSLSAYLDIINSSKNNSAWNSYFNAEILMMKSLVNAKLNNNVASAYNLYKASKLTKSTLKKYPNFGPIKTLHGFQLCAFSKIPESYTSIASFFGIDGDYDKGISEIKNSLKNSEIDFVKNKTKFIYIFAQKEFGNIDIVRISSEIENYKSSPILIYYEAYLLYKNMELNKAIDLLLENESDWNSKMNYLNYFTGKLLSYKLNDEAEIYFSKFILNTKTDDFKKSSYRYLAYLSLIKNDSVKYNYYKKLINSNKTKPTTESDKSAINEINSLNNIILIKSQLLYDGENYQNAEILLLSIDKKQICKTTNDYITYYYRLGSINQKLNKTSLAIINFEHCVTFTFNNKLHYQANAYLKLGELYVSINDIEKAKSSLEKCINLSNFPYSYSIHLKAKSLLKKVNQ